MRQFATNSTQRLKRITVLFVALITFLISPLASHRALCATMNDLFAQVGQMVPAFGGCFTSGDTLYVYLVPGKPGTLSQVDAALTEVFGSDRPSGQLHALAGKYTFTQLKAWLDPVTATVLVMSGTVAAGIDYTMNQVIVLVENPDLISQVEAQIATLGIPSGAAEIQLMPKIDAALTLQDRTRPDIGGLQIGFTTGLGTFVCTHWLADSAGTPGFVTNSHCSITTWMVDSTAYFQNLPPAPANFIGLETSDPPLFLCTNTGRMCRYSDSNFSTFIGITGGSTRGVIAQPTGLGSITWNGVDTFTITAQADPMVHDSVDKVGRTTGRTRGTVLLPCMNVNHPSGALLLCQFMARMNMTNWLLGGDSGSPVIEGSGSNATLVGIAWGSNHCVNKAGADVCPRVNCADGTGPDPIAVCNMVFSPISGIQNDLGPLTVCQNGSC